MSPDSLLSAAVGAVLVCVISFASWPGRVVGKVVCSASSLVVGIAALLVGGRSFQAAFNECVVQAESVRSQLSAFRQTNGSFPAALRELPGEEPCKRLVLRPLLQYKRSSAGYELAFSDWLVAHRASESAPFEAEK